MGLYTRKSHEREMRALREEYEQRLGELRAAASELKEETAVCPPKSPSCLPKRRRSPTR